MFPFTLKQLRTFKALATEKTFNETAKIIYLSQPSISRQIKLLEKNLKIKLIDRNKNKIILTENGQLFLQYSERILALCEESCRALIDLKNGERGNLIIGTDSIIGIYIIPKVLTLFTPDYPGISLKIRINSTQLIIQHILNQKMNIGIIEDKIPKQKKNFLSIEQFIEDEIKLIISKFHPFAKKRKINKNDLYQLNFITLHANSTIKKFINKTLQFNNVETKQLKTIMELNSIEGIKTAVSLGLGVAFVSLSAIEKEINLKTIKTLEIKNMKMIRKLSLITNPKSYESKPFKLFYTQLKSLKNNL